MMSITKTPFSDQCFILGNVWAYYKKEGDFFQQFCDLYDLSLPLARLISMGILDPDTLPAEVTDEISNAWEVFVTALEVPDNHYLTLADVFDASPLVEVQE